MTIVMRKPSPALIGVVHALGGRWSGGSALCRCPAHDDRLPSLSLRQGDRGILVTCFAGCPPADVLRAIRQLGPATYEPPHAPAHPIGRGDPTGVWAGGRDLRGTPGALYLSARGLTSVPPGLRYHPRCPLGPRPLTQFRPAVLVAVRTAGALAAVQRIFLTADASGYTEKLMLGQPRDGAWQSGPAADLLAVAEGFETAAAFATLHDLPCWAALGARRLDRLAIPETVNTLLVGGDNDAEGRRAVARAITRYARPGRTVVPALPPESFKDWADVLQAKRGGGSGT